MNDILKNRNCFYPTGYAMDDVVPGSADHRYLVFLNAQLQKNWTQVSLEEQAAAQLNADEYQRRHPEIARIDIYRRGSTASQVDSFERSLCVGRDATIEYLRDESDRLKATLFHIDSELGQLKLERAKDKQ